MQDAQLLEGLLINNAQRIHFEKALYLQYNYFIQEGMRKYNLQQDDSFSAYSDAVLAVLQNISNKSFSGQSSLKTYLFQIFSNKCIDLIRKRTTNKYQVHQSSGEPELLNHLPDGVKGVIEKLIDEQKMAAVRQQLEVIGQKCKDILLLYEDRYTDSEIAVELGYNTAAVAKTTRLRCLEKIREKMKSVLKSYE
jgi:RNA polymerase sigma-70 factor (ECF subfamily)